MKKARFKIKGMNCDSCATLIEDNLKKLAGVSNAKASFDSQKAVIMYDENQIGEEEIIKTIKETGNYELEKIVEEKEEKQIAKVERKLPNRAEYPRVISSKASFALGLLTMFSIISVAFNIAFATQNIKVSVLGEAKDDNKQDILAQPQSPQPLQPLRPTQQILLNPTVQTFEITKDDHVRGNLNAPIVFVEFSDFECPYCGKFYLTVKKTLADYPEKVKFVYKHFPISSRHPNAEKAAEASECANEQGKFWEYHDALFEKQQQGFSVDKFKEWAAELKLNTKKFNNCLDTNKYIEKIKADSVEGAAKGVDGTPGSFINGRFVNGGAVPYEIIKTIIDNTLNNQQL